MYVKSGSGYFVKFEGDSPLMTSEKEEAADLTVMEAYRVITKLGRLGYEAFMGGTDEADTDQETAVHEVDLNKKYVLVFRDRPSLEFLGRLNRAIEEWKTNDNPFLVIHSLNVELVRVDGVEDE